AVRYVKEEAMPCGQRISALLTRPEVASAAHFVGVLGGAGARYILDELARGALGSMPACELTDIHVAMVNAWRAGNHGYARSLYNRSLPPIARAQDVTLDFPSWQAEEPGFAEWWKGLVKEYEAKHPGVKVKLYSIPFANYVNQMTVRFAGQNPPDIVHLPSRNFASFAS